MKTRLREYLEENCMTHRKFADKIGISAATMHALVTGKHLPNIIHACKIEDLTLEFVKVRDWYDPKYNPKYAKKTNTNTTKKKVAKKSKLPIPKKSLK